MKPQIKTLTPKTIATAGTQVQITTTEIQAFSVWITADPANTGYIYVGDSSVDSTNGEPLQPGESIGFGCAEGKNGDWPLDLSDIYVDTATNGNIARVQYIGGS